MKKKGKKFCQRLGHINLFDPFVASIFFLKSSVANFTTVLLPFITIPCVECSSKTSLIPFLPHYSSDGMQMIQVVLLVRGRKLKSV